MKLRSAGLCFAVLAVVMLAMPAAADTIIDLYENQSEISVTVLPGWVALGDIVLCEPGCQCPGSVQGIFDPNDPEWSDVVRFAHTQQGYVAILYSDLQLPSYIYGPGELDKMITDGFAQPGDFMGTNSGMVIPETAPYTSFAVYRVWSDVNETEVPEPASLLLFGAGLLGLGKSLRKRLSH